MALLSQHLSSLLPMPLRPHDVPAADQNEVSLNPLIGNQARQSQVAPVTPAANSAMADFPADLDKRSDLPKAQDEDLGTLVKDMEDIDAPPPKGEFVDIRVPTEAEKAP